MVVRLVMLLALPFMFWACSSNEPTVAEAVAADANAAPAIPDSPGNAADVAAAATNAAASNAAAVNTAGNNAATPDLAPAAAPTPAPAATKDMVVKPSHLNVRKGPGLKNPVVRVIKGGTKVATQDCQGGWCKIGDGEYVSKKHLSAK